MNTRKIYSDRIVLPILFILLSACFSLLYWLVDSADHFPPKIRAANNAQAENEYINKFLLPYNWRDLGIEGYDGYVTKFQTEEILRHTFPAGWTKEIERIDCFNIFAKGIVANLSKTRLTYPFIQESIGKYYMSFFAETKAFKVSFILSFVMGHELAHANDWNHDSLGEPIKLELHNAIRARLSSQNPFPITQKNTDGQTKETEYWADISGAYFHNPKWLRGNFYEDWKIVNSYVKKTDPKFDPQKKLLERKRLIKSWMRPKVRYGRASLFWDYRHSEWESKKPKWATD